MVLNFTSIVSFFVSPACGLMLGYIAQIYSALVSLAYAPYILGKIGPEAYGLVGVFMVAQSWFHLLDAGFTPTVNRQSARFRAGAIKDVDLLSTVKGLESIVQLLFIPLVLVAAFFAQSIAESWLQRETISADEVAWSIIIMAAIFGIRWLSGVRRGILLGLEKHSFVYIVNIAISTLRYPLIPLYFYWVPAGAIEFFVYQLIISVFEVLVLWWLSRKHLPRCQRIGFIESLSSLKTISDFAIRHALLALLFVLVTQSDKIILSRVLTLAEFGYLTLAVTAAAGMRLLVLPIGQVIKPRLAKLYAQNNQQRLLEIYHRGTRFAVFVLSGITTVFLFYGEAVMFLWTSDRHIAEQTGLALSFYTLGNSVMGLCSFAYYLQFASGNLKLHTIGSLILACILIPCTFYFTNRFGVSGAAYTWAVIWISYLLTWVTFTHLKYLGSRSMYWLFRNVLLILVPCLLVGFVARQMLSIPESRSELLFFVLVLTSVLYMVAFFISGIAGDIKSFRRET